MRILLLTPPMTQLNTPYPATAYLTGFLRGKGFDVRQEDLSIQVALRLFSRDGLARVFEQVGKKLPAHFLREQRRYLLTADSVLRFLQGKDPTLAFRIVSREYLPEGPRFAPLQENNGDGLELAFGAIGIQDRAKYLASLYLDDLADLVRAHIDSRFELSRYGEKLAASAPSFSSLAKALKSRSPSLVDQILDELVSDLYSRHQPDVVGVTAPFPGNVYGAFRIARQLKEISPAVRTVLGGGYVNTELRELKEPSVFDFFDAIVMDDGEQPLLCLLDYFRGNRSASQLKRTWMREEGGQVVCFNGALEHDISSRDTGTPTYEGLDLGAYLSLLEMLNPMHRIWSDGRWNKLTLAHGCYWKKCNFCDVSLDYIGRYDPSSANLIVDRIEALMRETGQTGFHFVDEAAPPAVLRAMAERLIERGISISWWGNIRFEKTFTPELTQLLARSGCIAVSGGLEVASDRLLKLMNKGVTVEQVARVTRAFSEAGVFVHAYLMYGFPTQTEQETVDALERVRQLFEAGCIHSAFWHRFAATAHSPIGRDPERFGIRLVETGVPVTFARNDLPFEDSVRCDHDALGVGLKRALYNYMHGVGLELDLRQWFLPAKVCRAGVPSDLVARALR